MTALGLALSLPSVRHAAAPTGPETPLGPDFAVNGTFDGPTGWTLGTGWTISGGVLSRIAGASASNATQDYPSMIPGSIYRIRFTVTGASGIDNRVSGRVYGGWDSDGPTMTGNGIYQQDIAAPASPTGFGIVAVAGFAGTIDNFTIREVNPGT